MKRNLLFILAVLFVLPIAASAGGGAFPFPTERKKNLEHIYHADKDSSKEITVHAKLRAISFEGLAAGDTSNFAFRSDRSDSADSAHGIFGGLDSVRLCSLATAALRSAQAESSRVCSLATAAQKATLADSCTGGTVRSRTAAVADSSKKLIANYLTDSTKVAKALTPQKRIYADTVSAVDTMHLMSAKHAIVVHDPVMARQDSTFVGNMAATDSVKGRTVRAPVGSFDTTKTVYDHADTGLGNYVQKGNVTADTFKGVLAGASTGSNISKTLFSIYGGQFSMSRFSTTQSYATIDTFNGIEGHVVQVFDDSTNDRALFRFSVNDSTDSFTIFHRSYGGGSYGDSTVVCKITVAPVYDGCRADTAMRDTIDLGTITMQGIDTIAVHTKRVAFAATILRPGRAYEAALVRFPTATADKLPGNLFVWQLEAIIPKK